MAGTTTCWAHNAIAEEFVTARSWWRSRRQVISLADWHKRRLIGSIGQFYHVIIKLWHATCYTHVLCDSVMCVDIKDIDEGSNVESTGKEGEQADSDYISRLIKIHTHDHVLVFTDGSVCSPGSAGLVGCGACAAVLFPTSQENCGLRIKTYAVGTGVSSEKCETEGILLGIEMAVQYTKVWKRQILKVLLKVFTSSVTVRGQLIYL